MPEMRNLDEIADTFWGGVNALSQALPVGDPNAETISRALKVLQHEVIVARNEVTRLRKAYVVGDDAYE